MGKSCFPGNRIMDGPVKCFAYLFFAIILLISSWEVQFARAAEKMAIPEQAIRIRVIAHSDSPQDQWVKRRVTDAVVDNINRWAPSLKTIEQARETVRDHIRELEDIARRELARYGFPYGARVELAQAPFPEKVFWGLEYGEGNYETLRITLGEGRGSNWWCVLFPPLCFADLVFKKDGADQTSLSGGGDKGDGDKAEGGQGTKPVEIRFFFADILEKAVKWLKSLWQ